MKGYRKNERRKIEDHSQGVQFSYSFFTFSFPLKGNGKPEVNGIQKHDYIY